MSDSNPEWLHYFNNKTNYEKGICILTTSTAIVTRRAAASNSRPS